MVWTAVGPCVEMLAIVLVLVIGSCLCCKKSMPLAPVRSKKELLIGILGFVVAGYCFFKGLKNKNDYLRMWHGMWHLLVCIPSFYLWQIHSSRPYSLHEFFNEMGSSVWLK